MWNFFGLKNLPLRHVAPRMDPQGPGVHSEPVKVRTTSIRSRNRGGGAGPGVFLHGKHGKHFNSSDAP